MKAFEMIDTIKDCANGTLFRKYGCMQYYVESLALKTKENSVVITLEMSIGEKIKISIYKNADMKDVLKAVRTAVYDWRV